MGCRPREYESRCGGDGRTRAAKGIELACVFIYIGVMETGKKSIVSSVKRVLVTGRRVEGGILANEGPAAFAPLSRPSTNEQSA